MIGKVLFIWMFHICKLMADLSGRRRCPLHPSAGIGAPRGRKAGRAAGRRRDTREQRAGCSTGVHDPTAHYSTASAKGERGGDRETERQRQRQRQRERERERERDGIVRTAQPGLTNVICSMTIIIIYNNVIIQKHYLMILHDFFISMP